MIDGHWAPDYAPVARTLADLLAEDPAAGAAVAVYVDGRPVVDVWGGRADPRTGARWAADTLAATFSCTKGLLAACAVRAAQDGALDLDAPVAAYWPAFAAHGKAAVTTRMVLSHSAGLPALDADLTRADALAGTPVVEALERQRPLWPPGSGHAYHAMTYGWLVAEILRRATGAPLAEHLARLAGRPDLLLGVTATDAARVAPAGWDRARSRLTFPADAPSTPWRRRTVTRAITLGRAFTPELVGDGTGLDDPAVLAAGLPAVGVVATARALARTWSRVVTETDGAPALLRPEAVRDATRVLAEGPGVLDLPPPHARWATGFMLRSPIAPMLAESSFGHDGAGGQLAFADPVARVGFAYLTNRLRNHDDDRAERLVGSLRSVVDGRTSVS
ncbi:serine hydrolase domain-containing protein [Jiangella alkaliphila]|uniref:CubicO group peptidase, beta-lactamase class C family n=1 Tax=Jiangella alkaliphila TaxID=419479 RepID=A0A1H2LYW2_9ACTN|nr:serine hydrolase domain-containing protein [Jiangella alkaliphila]SDU86109.1 CubicO group peptidase, beta-lactamase class C family [Jiangella alkaliphila]